MSSWCNLSLFLTGFLGVCLLIKKSSEIITPNIPPVKNISVANSAPSTIHKNLIIEEPPCKHTYP